MAFSKLNRRTFLARGGLIGCSLAASPLVTPMTFAATPNNALGDNRLVVIILRGGMDGLGVVQPYGDPDYAGHRGMTTVGSHGGAIDLDGFFAVHPALGELMPLWRAGELGFLQAVSTPYRDKRSHFDGQDLLEAGTQTLMGATGRDGWLNRMLQAVPGIETDTAYAIGRDDMLLLRGRADVANWSPDAQLNLTPQAQMLVELMMAGDPLFADATAEAIMLAQGQTVGQTMGQIGVGDGEMRMPAEQTMQQSMQQAQKNFSHKKVADFAAEKLRGDTRVAAFSLNGWDTHASQDRPLGKALGKLSDTILHLRDGLGPVWGKTTVVAITEFGRTARLNGTKGTDHGTGGAMIMAGGALRGGRVYGDWPGLDEADLYQRRDVMPTRDVRSQTAWIMRGLFGISAAVLEQSVFPGMEMGDDPGLIL